MTATSPFTDEQRAESVRRVSAPGGSMTKEAARMGVSRQTIWNWCNAAKAITRQRCPKCGRAISHTCRAEGE